MKPEDTGCAEMLPSTKDYTLDWISSQMQDLCRYWDTLSCWERAVVLEELGDTLDSISNEELTAKFEKLASKNEDEERHRKPDLSTCMEIIKGLTSEQKRYLVDEFTSHDIRDLKDHELTKILSNALHSGSDALTARFFALRNTIGQRHMQPVE